MEALFGDFSDEQLVATFELLVLLGMFLLYMLPWVISLMRGHKNKVAIFFVNLFFGATVIGWFIAFIWAFTNPAKEVVVVNNTVPAPENDANKSTSRVTSS